MKFEDQQTRQHIFLLCNCRQCRVEYLTVSDLDESRCRNEDSEWPTTAGT